MRSIVLALGMIITIHGAAEAQAAGVHACSLLTDADIAKVTGTKNQFNTPPDRTDMPNGATVCSYVGLDLTLTPRVTKQNFETNRKLAAQERNTTTEPATGVGEEAYFYVKSRSTSANVGIVFRVGTYQVALGDRVRSDSVAWFKPKAVELAKIAAKKLP